MSDAATASITPTPDSDPLGLRRCPNCLYDRFGIDAASPCPECGYIAPRGVCVLTFARVSESPWTIGISICFAALLFGFLVRDPIGTLHEFDYFVVVIACSVVSSCIRWWRVSGSGDAYVSQIWLSSNGIGLEPDADRFTIARPFDRVARPALSVAPFVAMFCTGRPIWRHSATTLAVIGGVAGCIAVVYAVAWWRRRRKRVPRLDAVAPQLFDWRAVDSLDVDAKRQVVSVTLRLKGFSDKHRVIRFTGTSETVASIRDVVHRYRRMPRGDNPTRP